MKKVIILATILILTASASALTCSFRVATPETAPGGYLPGDTITIELVADFACYGFAISRITDDVPTSPVDLTGTYDGISVWSYYTINPQNGDNYLVNSNNWLVDNAIGFAVGGSIHPSLLSDVFINDYDGILLTYTY
ncbi:MAG: hypothetical protein JXB29_05275 [Sedimentisphaerales bacterium]|nr:hypothetical protein [Sedimentisphaerales bacterium]